MVTRETSYHSATRTVNKTHKRLHVPTGTILGRNKLPNLPGIPRHLRLSCLINLSGSQATGGIISVQFRSFDLVQIVHIECIGGVVEIPRGIPDDFITNIGDLARWRVTDLELAGHSSLPGPQ